MRSGVVGVRFLSISEALDTEIIVIADTLIRAVNSNLSGIRTC